MLFLYAGGQISGFFVSLRVGLQLIKVTCWAVWADRLLIDEWEWVSSSDQVQVTSFVPVSKLVYDIPLSQLWCDNTLVWRLKRGGEWTSLPLCRFVSNPDTLQISSSPRALLTRTSDLFGPSESTVWNCLSLLIFLALLSLWALALNFSFTKPWGICSLNLLLRHFP